MSDLKKFIERMMTASAAITLCTTAACSSSHGIQGSSDARADAQDTSMVDASDVSVRDASDASTACIPRPIDDSTCDLRVEYPCGIPFAPASYGSYSDAECRELCEPFGPTTGAGCRALDDKVVRCALCVEGRRPHGFEQDNQASQSAVASWFAEVANLELASIDAFQFLHDDLLRLHAPSELRVRALEGKEDEVRHAQTMLAFAKQAGAKIASIKFAVPNQRSLFEVAMENAIEGCIRETLGAFMAQHQSHHAQDEVFARAMTDIAREETNHAQLSWDIHAWAMPLLSTPQQVEIQQAMQKTRDDLIETISTGDEFSAKEFLGLPSREAMLVCLRELGSFSS